MLVNHCRLCVSNNRSNSVPFPKPAKYDRSDWNLLFSLAAGPNGDQLSRYLNNFGHPLPNNKHDLNNGGIISTGRHTPRFSLLQLEKRCVCGYPVLRSTIISTVHVQNSTVCAFVVCDCLRVRVSTRLHWLQLEVPRFELHISCSDCPTAQGLPARNPVDARERRGDSRTRSDSALCVWSMQGRVCGKRELARAAVYSVSGAAETFHFAAEWTINL